MFRDLYAVARHTPLHLIITPNGEQLKVIVTPKPSGDAADNPALAKPFSAVGTPEDLDREFPAALAKYAGAVNDLRASIDLPLDAFEDAKKKAATKDQKKADKQRQKEEEAKRRSDAAKKAAETRAAKAEEARTAKEAKAKQRADAAAAKKAAKAGKGIQLPGATQPSSGVREDTAWPFPTGSRALASEPAAVEAQHRADLPGKEDCLLDYRNLKRVHGANLTRRLFIKKAKTGRRYEKLWPNWAKFVKAAEAQLELPIEENTRAADSATEATTAAAEVQPATEPAASAGARSTDNGPAASTAQHSGSEGDQGTAAAAAGADVIEGSDPSGSATKSAPAPAVATEPPPPRGSDEAAPAADADQPAVIAPVAPSKQYALVDLADDAVVRTSRYPYVAGEKLDVEIEGEERRYLVESTEGDTSFARQVLKFQRLILDEAGNPLAKSDELYEIADQVGELADRDWRVVRIEENAYYVRAAKPRLRGPVASASAPATTTTETAG